MLAFKLLICALGFYGRAFGDTTTKQLMTKSKGRVFGLPPKGFYEESAVADVVLIDPSASVGMTESRRGCHEYVQKSSVIPSEVEESVNKNPAKRLNYERTRTRCLSHIEMNRGAD